MPDKSKMQQFFESTRQAFGNTQPIEIQQIPIMTEEEKLRRLKALQLLQQQNVPMIDLYKASEFVKGFNK